MAGGEERGPEQVPGRRLGAIALVAVMVLAAFLVAITVEPGQASGATPAFRSLRFGIVNLQVTTFNPMKITLVDEYVVVFNVYSTLLSYDKDYKVVGDLAYNWTISANGTVWTFNLVHTAFFTDPTNPTDRSHPVTAQDVVYSYNLNQANVASIWWSYTTSIKGVAAVDNYTVRIVTFQPFAAMYSTLTGIPIMPQYWWSAQPNPINSKPKFPIGSGPMYYDFANSSLPGFMILMRNPNYYGMQYYCQQSRPNQVWFISYSDPGLMMNDFTSGTNNLNGVIGLDPTSYTSPTLTTFPRVAVNEGFVGEYAINVMSNAERQQLVNSGLTQFRNGANNQVLLNYTVRKAIAMSINKTALVKDALLGLGHVADTLVPDSNPWHYSIPASQTFPFNPGLARSMLYTAGWKWNSAGNPATNSTFPLYQKGATNNTVYWPLLFRFYTLNTEPTWQAAVADIVPWLNEAGIQTEDRLGSTSPGYGLYSVNQMSSYWLSGDYDMWLWDWVFSPISDPSTDVMEVETTMAIGPTSDNFYSNSTFDSIYNQSLVTLDHNARQQLVNQMQSMVYQYASYILPYYQLDLFAFRNDAPSAGATAWTNWGNWSVEGGLAPDSDLPALWFQVYPANQPPPVISSLAPVQTYSGLTATLNAVASDSDGDPLTYSWNFGDGSTTTTTTGTTSHIYTNAGNYTVMVRVSDGEWTACESSTATIVQNPGGPVNLPPNIQSFVFMPVAPQVNQTVTMTLVTNDSEGDSLYITLKFGDGASTVKFLDSASVDTRTNQTVTVTHVYTATGNYTANVTVTDNHTSPGLNHSPFYAKLITVWPASTGGGGGGGGGGVQTNLWINYGVPLAIVAIIVVAVAAVLLRRRGAAKKEEESEKAERNPPEPPPPS